MNKVLLLFLFCFSSYSSMSQGFFELGFAEKVWVLTHPFSATKAKKITHHVLEMTDSLSKVHDWKRNVFKERDAFRHGYWMALMAHEIGPKRAIRLGNAHEKRNEQDLKKGLLEDGYVPDNISIEMDRMNNKTGIELGLDCESCSRDQILQKVVYKIGSGSFVFIKQNTHGEFLNQKGEVILPSEWRGNPNSPRELVKSSF